MLLQDIVINFFLISKELKGAICVTKLIVCLRHSSLVSFMFKNLLWLPLLAYTQ